MNMKTKIIIYLAALLAVAAATKIVAKQLELPKARVTALVVDEQGSPMSGATVKFVFGESSNANAIVKVGGVTGNDGIFAGEGYSDGGYGADITKNNFYPNGLGAPALVDVVNGRWQPWNPTVKVVLRKIEKPVPLYGKQAWIEIPQTNTPCGYDLEAGDWIAPYGKGKTVDFVMTLNRQYENRRKFNVSVVLSFSNALDGIQETKLPEDYRNSIFKWPRLAPDTGYEATFTTRLEAIPGKGYNDTASEKQAYFFRVRTVERDGKIVSALYGKIGGGLRLAPSNSKTCELYLAYYLNPTSLDRNMEFDLKHNLLTNIGQFEDLREP
jgi:hypothetical protein